MRIMVMFDLPITSSENMREYRKFRKFLIKSGFMMMQESIYCKLVPNSNVAEAVVDSLRKNTPIEGLVQVLKITEKQFAKMDYLVGSRRHEVIDSDERIIVL